jgi:phosphoglycolate phosphatase
MIRLVLFDIDGTLVHTGRAGMRAFAKVFESEFKIPNGVEHIKFHGRTDKSLVREFFSINSVPATPENFERFFERYIFWLDHLIVESETIECPGIRQFISDIRALPQPPLMGLLTGNILLGAEIKLRHFNLWREFEIGGFADDHEDRDQIAHAVRNVVRVPWAATFWVRRLS